MAEEEVGLRTTLKDRRQTAAGLRDIEGGLDRVGRSAQTAGTRARAAGRGFESMRRTGRLAAAGIRLGFVAALGAGYAAVRLLKSSFDEAREAQKTGALTRATIKATGGAANVTGRQVERLSTRLSQMAGIDDELVQSGGNVLLTFKNVRNEMGKNNKIFNQATKAAVDLSTTPLLNGNVTGASKMLGKALNDPLKGISALTKAGVQFSEGQIEQIKNFVEQGKLLGAQKIILGEVNSQVGGAARAQRTWGDVANVTFHNIEERIGLGLLPLLDRFNRWFSTDGAHAIDGYLDVFEAKGIPALQHFTDEAIPLARRVLPKVAGVLGTIRDVVVDAAPYAERLIDAFNNMPDWAKKGIAGAGVTAYLGKKTGVFAALGSLLRGGKNVGGLVSSVKPVPVFVTNPGFGGGVGGTVGKGVAATETAAVAAGATSTRAVVARQAAAMIPQVLAAAGITLGIRELNNRVAPDATQPPIAPGSGGTGAVPGSLDQAFPDDNAVNSALEGIKGAVGGLFSSLTGADHAAQDANNSLATLLLTPMGMAPQYQTSLEQLLIGPLDTATTATEGFGTTLGAINRTNVAPPFSTPGLPQSWLRANDYKGLLDQVGNPVTTRVNANTSPATTAVDSLAQHIRDVLTSAATTVNVALSGLGGHRAAGGPVTAGVPYVVGERRPELFVPKVDGYILPRVPGGYRTGDTGGNVNDPDMPDGGGSRAATTIVPLIVDGKEIARVTLDGFETIGARR